MKFPVLSVAVREPPIPQPVPSVNKCCILKFLKTGMMQGTSLGTPPVPPWSTTARCKVGSSDDWASGLGQLDCSGGIVDALFNAMRSVSASLIPSAG